MDPSNTGYSRQIYDLSNFNSNSDQLKRILRKLTKTKDALLLSMRRYLIADILVSVCIGVCGALLFFNGLNAIPAPVYFSIVTGALLLLIGLISAFQTVRYFLKGSMMAYRILELDTGRIVWLYYSKLNLMPYGVGVLNRCHFFVCTLDGAVFTLKASEVCIKDAMQHALEENPGIVTGYSVDREQLFRIDPHLLKNDE